MTDQIDNLIARVEAATGPDREIDGACALLLGWTHEKMERDRHAYWREPGETRWYIRSELPRYTASIDATLAVTEALDLPWMAVMREAQSLASGKIDRMPVALLVATLRAYKETCNVDG